MRKWALIITVSIIALATVGFFVIKGKSSHQREHVFYFYPKSNTYFDSSSSRYFFPDSNGDWQEASSPPEDLRPTTEKKARIVSTPEVWKNNQYHRLVYSVALYKSPNDLKETIVISKAGKSSGGKKDSLEKTEPKKGIEGFFDKLFKGKKSQPENDSTRKSPIS